VGREGRQEREDWWEEVGDGGLGGRGVGGGAWLSTSWVVGAETKEEADWEMVQTTEGITEKWAGR